MSEIVQIGFDYNELDEDTRVFLKVKADSIRTRLKRTAEDIIAIGQDLMEVKDRLREENNNKRGRFLSWIDNEFGMTDRSARNFMSVAERFGNNLSEKFSGISVSVLYELAAPSTPDTIIEKVESGELTQQAKDQEITLLEAIKNAKAKEAEEERKRREEVELAHKNLQSEFDLFKQQTEQEKKQQAERIQQELNLKNQELDLLNRQKQLRDQEYATLEAEKEQIEQSKVQILQEDTPETKAKLEEAEQKLQRLEEQEKNLKEKNKQKNEQLQQKIDRIKELTDEIQSYNRDNQLIAHNKEIRFKWQQACDAFHLGINQGFARMVSPIDARQAFESDDWARLAELEATLKQAIEKLSGLRESMTSQFVDASIVEG